MNKSQRTLISGVKERSRSTNNKRKKWAERQEENHEEEGRDGWVPREKEEGQSGLWWSPAPELSSHGPSRAALSQRLRARLTPCSPVHGKLVKRWSLTPAR